VVLAEFRGLSRVPPRMAAFEKENSAHSTSEFFKIFFRPKTLQTTAVPVVLVNFLAEFSVVSHVPIQLVEK
jgi:hypothetical protein